MEKNSVRDLQGIEKEKIQFDFNKKDLDKSLIRIKLDVGCIEWRKWCRDANDMGFTGIELLNLAFQLLNESKMDVSYFDEMSIIPANAYRKLCKADNSFKSRERIQEDYDKSDLTNWEKILVELR